MQLAEPATGTMSEHAFIDTFPAEDSNGFSGASSVFPPFASGIVIVSDISRGLFILRPRLQVLNFENNFETTGSC